MIICHVCGEECSDGAELCPICGAELLNEESAGETVFEEIVINKPVLAASVEDVVTAEIYRDVLRENNIPFSCGDINAEASMRLTFGGGFVAEDIYVDEDDLERAEALYEEVLNSETEFGNNESADAEEEWSEE